MLRLVPWTEAVLSKWLPCCVSFVRAANEHATDAPVWLTVQLGLGLDYAAQMFILICFMDICSKQCNCMTMSATYWKSVFWEDVESFFFSLLAFSNFHAVWGIIIIFERTLTLFLVYNFCLAFWSGWLVWHHQQPGLLPVWRRRLLPVHTLHQKGTQTDISSATPPVCHIYRERERLIFITFIPSVFVLIIKIFLGVFF